MRFIGKKWMRIRVSIGNKIMIGFLLVIVMLIIVSGVSIKQMNQMGDKATIINNKWMPGVQILGGIKADLINGQRLAVMVILEPDDKIREQLEGRLAVIIDDLKQKQALYERSLIASKEERSLYDRLVKSENEYFSLLPTTYAQKSKLLQLGRANGAHALAQELEASLAQALDILAKATDLNAAGAQNATDDSVRLYDAARQLAIISSTLAALLGIIIAIFISRLIAKPMIVMVKTAKRIASGDLTSEAIKVKSRDEVGDLAGSFNEMSGSLRDLIRQVGSGAEDVAASAEQLTAGAEQVNKATEQIAVTICDVAEGSGMQVRSVDESAKAIHEISSAVQHIAVNAQNVTSTSIYASEIAMAGNEGIRKAVEQMNAINITVNGLAQAVKGLGERSLEIGQIVKVITDIASQTNLLSLNAAIEAARAGEHGRGFAVVADEVRGLSEQSAKAARQIAQLIRAIQDETSLAVQSMEAGRIEVAAGIEVVNQTGQSFEQILRSVDDVANQIQEVSSSAQQVSASMEQMVSSVHVISAAAEKASTGTQDLSAAAEEQIASMEEISASAAALSHLSGDLNILVGKFKV